jgi:tRNA A-37 threonylcarbamoyl transferase component Bud32/predicted nucleotidyltransferase
MSCVSKEQLVIIRRAASRIAKKYKIAGLCLYGSRVAGYSRTDSDFDLIIVLHDYPYAVKYIYAVEEDMKISALVVDLVKFEKDAISSFLGEFVIGRLLHIYEPIQNKDLFERLEVVYKKRVILDEIHNIVKSANVLSTQLVFPLEYIMFSKVRYRSILYPNATYSYYHTYTGRNARLNIEFALIGYQKALSEILSDDKELLITDPCGKAMQISEKKVDVQRNKKIASLKLTKKLQEFSSYFIHAYAGRHTLHHAIKEAESKISRHKANPIILPKFIANPKELYWKLPEGLVLVVDDKDWLGQIAKSSGFSKYTVSKKHILATGKGATVLYVIQDPDSQTITKSLVVKSMIKPNAVKWTALHKLSTTIDVSRSDPLFRLGNEYKALRHIRFIGLHAPIVQSVVLNRMMLVTEFIEGKSISDMLKQYSNKNDVHHSLRWVNAAGKNIAKIHACKCTLGNIKPSNLIVSNNRVYFTGVDEFGFNTGDPLRDIISFINHVSENILTNTVVSRQILEEFLEGYLKEAPQHIKKTLISGRNQQTLYKKFNPLIAQTIKEGISKFVN